MPRSELDEPSVFLLGCDGCGAEALRSYLELRGGLSLGRLLPGERAWEGESPNFFSQEDRYVRGLAWYKAHYAGTPVTVDAGSPTEPRAAAWMDASAYLASPFAPARIRAQLAAHAPRHRFLIVLRDPAELAWVLWQRRAATPRAEGAHGTISSVLHGYFEGHNFSSRTSLEATALFRCLASTASRRHRPGVGRPTAALAPTAEAWQHCVTTGCGWNGCVVGAGIYAPQLRAWREAYPPEQLAVFTLGELHKNGGATAVRRRVDAFLGLPGGGDAQCSLEALEHGAQAALVEGRGVPEGAARTLSAFFATLSEALRHELNAIGEDVAARWPDEAWLWADRRMRGGEAAGHSTEPAREGVGGAASTPAAGVNRAYTLPKLFLLGCEKCGSTSLAFLLARHPQLQFARCAFHCPGQTDHRNTGVCAPADRWTAPFLISLPPPCRSHC